MTYPADFKYSRDHEWVKIEDGICTIGITNHAQEQLGDVVYVELPEVGKSYEKGDVFGVVESVKAVVDCYIPVGGEVVEINEELEDQAEMINTDAHGAGWMVKIRLDNPADVDELMDKAAYETFLVEVSE